MRRFGLIGYPLIHSFSQKYFTEKFSRESIKDAVYENFELEDIQTLPELISENPGLRGLNVTIPHKQTVIKMLDEVDEEPAAIGAVNTIKISSGKLKGYNTDHVAFIRSLIPLLKPHHRKALVLGTGGSSLAVKYVLEKLGIEFLSVSRKPSEMQIGYAKVNQEIIQEHLLIVNATPVGMFPDTTMAPGIPYECLSSRHLLYDLIYNPEETLFLKRGKDKGAVVKNGYEMLILQAEEAWKIWCDF